MAYAERSSGKLTGRWCCDVQYRHPDGSVDRWHKAFDGKREAEGAEAYFKATGQKPAHMDPRGVARGSFRDVAQRFRAKREGKEWLEAHGTTNEQRLRFAEDFLGDLDVTQIRKDALKRYVAHLDLHVGRNGEPPANSTVNRYLDAVSKVLTYAIEDDLIPALPKFPRRDNNKGKKRGAVSWDLEDAICADLESRGNTLDAFCFRVLAGTGMRAGEFTLIRPDMIDIPEQRENTGIMLAEDITKGKKPRWVPLVPEAARKLKAIVASGRVPNSTHLYKVMLSTMKRLGDSQGVTPHWLRHTANTRMLDTGANEVQVARIIGHSKGGMQSRYYHGEKAVLFAVAEKVQSRLGDFRKTSTILPFNREEAPAQVLATAVNS